MPTVSKITTPIDSLHSTVNSSLWTTSLATRSVKYVTYPTKVIFKSVKLIPTMIVATILQRKVYTMKEYIAAIMLCLGAAGYSYGSGNNNPSSSPTQQNSNAYGILLLTVSICCDAIVPNLQKMLLSSSSPQQSASTKDKAESGGLTATELMINTNAVGLAAVLVYMLVTGDLGATIQTSLVHPRLALYLALVGLCLATAVLAYTKLIQVTDSVVAVSVATLRKVVTIVLSYVVFPKPFLFIHLFSGMLVLGGILLGFHAKEKR
jgi:solute carrier family 35 (adenosine 3'-phospho 5'-phosphosulfate transporter), member B3